MPSRDQQQTDDLVTVRRAPAWTTAMVMLVAVALLLATFYWVFIRLEPALDDLVDRSDHTPTTELTLPAEPTPIQP